jgi:transposase
MLRPEGEGLRVYLHRAPVDMRLQRTGLASRVQEAMGQDPLAGGAIFAFIGKRYDRIKLLAWDTNGFVEPSTRDPRQHIRTETTLLSVASLVRT